MKQLRSSLEIKKAIIRILKKENGLSIRRLDIKLNTGSQTIKSHCKELEFFGIVKIRKTKEGSRNGRPYSVVELTDYGRKIKS